MNWIYPVVALFLKREFRQGKIAFEYVRVKPDRIPNLKTDRYKMSAVSDHRVPDQSNDRSKTLLDISHTQFCVLIIFFR